MAREIKDVIAHRTTLCCAITGYAHSYQVPYIQRCQNDARHFVDGVALCGTHFNAAFRRELAVVRTLRVAGEDDL